MLIICNDPLIAISIIRGIHGIEHLFIETLDVFSSKFREIKALGEVRYALIYDCSDEVVNEVKKQVQVEDIGKFKNLRFIIEDYKKYLAKVLWVAKSLSSTAITTSRK